VVKEELVNNPAEVAKVEELKKKIEALTKSIQLQQSENEALKKKVEKSKEKGKEIEQLVILIVT